MYQHLDLLAAQSVAHERERVLHLALRQREQERRVAGVDPVASSGQHRWHDALVRLHLLHAPSH
jgi:hypothetical protein